MHAINERQRTRSNLSSLSYLGSQNQSQTASQHFAHLQYSKDSHLRTNQTADFKDRLNTNESSYRGDLAYHARKGSQNPPGSPWMANR